MQTHTFVKMTRGTRDASRSLTTNNGIFAISIGSQGTYLPKFEISAEPIMICTHSGANPGFSKKPYDPPKQYSVMTSVVRLLIR